MTTAEKIIALSDKLFAINEEIGKPFKLNYYSNKYFENKKIGFINIDKDMIILLSKNKRIVQKLKELNNEIRLARIVEKV